MTPSASEPIPAQVAPPVGSAAIVHLRRARDLMDQRFAEPLDLGFLAGEAGYSRHHFARMFHAAFGEPPGAYLTRRRMERAKELLRDSELTVTEVCHRVGFASLGSFSARFTDLVGVAPSAYRRVHAGADSSPPIPGCFLMIWSRPPPATKTAIEEKPSAAGRI